MSLEGRVSSDQQDDEGPRRDDHGQEWQLHLARQRLGQLLQRLGALNVGADQRLLQRRT